MKKLLVIFSAVALMSGCARLEEPTHPDYIGGGNTETDLPEVIYVSVAADEDEQNEEDPQTRTYVDANKNVLWHGGDAFSYSYNVYRNHKYAYVGADGVSDAEFERVNNFGTEDQNTGFRPHALYPYDPDMTSELKNGSYNISTSIPTTQTYAANSFGKGANVMVAVSESFSVINRLSFKNACGFLVLKLYGQSNVKSIELSAIGGEKISGAATITASYENNPTITMADNAVSRVVLDCSNGGSGVALGADAAHATEFWFALPPVTFQNGFRIEVTDVNDIQFLKSTTSKVQISRNNIQPMAALQVITSDYLTYTTTNGNQLNVSNAFDKTVADHYKGANGRWIVTFSEPITTIKKEAFKGTELTSITIPESVTTIEDGVFWSTKISEITIPGGVNAIGIDAFYKCSSLTSVTFLPSPDNSALNIGCTYGGTLGTTTQGSFYSAKLTNIDFNRNFVFKDKNGNRTPGAKDEGIFAQSSSNHTTTVTIGDKVQTISEYMFCNLPVSELTIPGNVTEIKNFAFENCTKLSSLTFNSGSESLIMGFQDNTNERGPFYQSPLQYIKLDRNIVYNTNYAKSCDDWDEGAFSNQYYEDDTLTAKVLFGSNVTSIPPYMFASMRMTQLHFPANITYISKYAVDNCLLLDAIVFYNETKSARPTLEDYALGAWTKNPDQYPETAMDRSDYYIFVPRGKKFTAYVDYTVGQANYTEWEKIGRVITDDNSPTDPQVARIHESRYLNREGYEWYTKRYVNHETITPPTE